MEFIIFNALLYLITLIVYWKIKCRFDLGFLILVAYALIASLAIPYDYFLGSIYPHEVTLLPFVYLFIVLLIFIRPYLKYDESIVERLKVRSLTKLKIIAYLLILSMFFSAYILLPEAIKNVQGGEWRNVRNELYSGDLEVVMYNNFIEKIMLIYNQYFRVLSILIFFYFLTLKRQSKIFIFLLGLSCFVPIMLMSICTSSRGMMLNVFLEFAAGFILFKPQFTEATKKKIYTTGIVFVSIILIYSIAVTVSRFGEETSYGSSELSLLDYFGQPMVVFNDGVFDMYSFANGKYFFKLLFEILGFDSTYDQIRMGGHWGVGFYTFIGAFFIDFGPIGTLIIALVFPFFIKKNVDRKVIYFENLFLYFFFFLFFLEGVFVTGESSVISWLFAITAYLFLKL